MKATEYLFLRSCLSRTLKLFLLSLHESCTLKSSYKTLSALPYLFLSLPMVAKVKQKKNRKNPKFHFQIAERQILTCERTAGEISFEWSHHMISSTNSIHSIIHSRSARLQKRLKTFSFWYTGNSYVCHKQTTNMAKSKNNLNLTCRSTWINMFWSPKNSTSIFCVE